MTTPRRSTLLSAVALLPAAAAALWNPPAAHAQPATPIPLPHRVFLPALYAGVDMAGQTPTPLGPLPTADAPQPTWPDNAVYAGCTTHWATDEDGDGDPDERQRADYDAAGRITLSALDDDADGDDEYVLRDTYRADGKLLVEEVDYDGDGALDWRDRYVYGGPGGLWPQVREHDDLTGSGDHTWRYTFTGRLLTMERATRPNGEPFMSLRYRYDGELRVHTEADFDGDGHMESNIATRWEGGRIVEDRSSIVSPELNTNTLYRYAYDDAGRLIELRYGESETQWRTIVTLRYGPSGFNEGQEFRDVSKSPPVVDLTREYDYQNGRLVRLLERRPGKPVESTTATYSCPTGGT